MKKITVAENAGFCFGVKRATDRLEQALKQAQKTEFTHSLPPAKSHSLVQVLQLWVLPQLTSLTSKN